MKKFLVLLMFVMMFSFSSAALTDNLISYWKLDGSDFSDAQGSNDATNQGSSSTTGILNEGRDHDGINDRVDLAVINNMSSVSFWFKVADTSGGASDGIAGQVFDPTEKVGDWLMLVGTDGYIDFGIYEATGGSLNYINAADTVVDDDAWHHVVILSGTGGLKMYIDGDTATPEISDATTFMLGQHSVENFTIGARGSNGAWNYGDVSIDEVGVWSDRLTTSEITELYGSGSPPSHPFLTSPVITNIEPTDASVVINDSSTLFNATAITQNNKAFVNVSLYLGGAVNQTKSITGEYNQSGFLVNFSQGTYNWSIEFCDNESICSSTTNRTITSQSWANYVVYGPAAVGIGNTQRFGATINHTSLASVTAANFIYNGTINSASITGIGSTQTNFTTDFLIPDETGIALWYFNFTLSDSETGNTTHTNITANAVSIDDCSVFTNPLYNFTMFDEQNPAKLDGSTDSTNFTLNLQIYDATGSSLINNYAVSKLNTNPLRVCLENALGPSDDYKIDLQMQYKAKNYSTEFYNIKNEQLTSADSNTNISLYPLLSASSQEFTLTYRDSSFLPVSNAVIQVQRRYVDEGIFRTVEQPITDSNGQTVVHLELENVVYNFVILVNGVTQATFNNKIAQCQNPSFNDCTITLTDVFSEVEVTDYSTLSDLSFTFKYNENTRVLSVPFSLRSGNSGTVVLNVTHFDNYGNNSICNEQLLSSGGTLSCTIPTSFGNSSVVGVVYLNGEQVGTSLISLGQDPQEVWGLSRVFLAILLVITLLGISVVGEPQIAGLMIIITSLILIPLNLIASTGIIGSAATILWFVIAVVIVLIKGGNR